MLCLKRYPGETIVINNGEIVITVIDVKFGFTRLGIEAPRQVTVHRGEVQDRINRGEPNGGTVARREDPLSTQGEEK